MSGQRKRVMIVFGTRPEAVKLAPIILALRESPDFEPIVVVTAQHREMLDQVTDLFGIGYDADLDIMRPRQTLADITTRALSGLDALVATYQPDAMMVQGDTTTTFVGALAAHYHQVPVVHVEAGLRTHNRYSPFPEEMNRQLTARLTTLHLAPTPESCNNLVLEGIDRRSIVVTGNSVIDALLWTVGRRVEYGDPALEHLDDDPRRVLLVTAHRRESWGEPMVGVGRALGRIARDNPDLLVVLPVHRNPTVREALLPPLADLPNVIVTEPLAYGGFARLIDRADVVLTDSGGIQEEAPSLGKPVLVMRENTERPEAVTAGTAKLIGTDEAAVVEHVTRLLHDRAAYEAMANAVNPYGDGRAAERSVAALAHLFDLGPAPAEFTGQSDRDGDLDGDLVTAHN